MVDEFYYNLIRCWKDLSEILRIFNPLAMNRLLEVIVLFENLKLETSKPGAELIKIKLAY